MLCPVPFDMFQDSPEVHFLCDCGAANVLVFVEDGAKNTLLASLKR
jgi:hypothetical protein